MTVHKFGDARFDVMGDGPRSDEISWLPLGMVVYSWTDKREAATDTAWWKTAGGYVHSLRANVQRPEEMPVVTAPATDHSMPVEPVTNNPVAVTTNSRPGCLSISQTRTPPWVTVVPEAVR